MSSPVLQAAVFRLYPNASQRRRLLSWMGACRFVWNQFVAYNKDLYSARKRFAFHSELSAFLPDMKHVDGYEWLADVPAISLVDVSRSYDLALRNALADRKAIRSGKKLGGKARGFPTFKKKRGDDGSLYLSSQSVLSLTPVVDEPHKARGHVSLSKLGTIRVRGGRWPRGDIKSATVSHRAGQWLLSIRFEGEAPWTGAKPSVDAIGGDLGLSSFLTWSDGDEVQTVAPPRHLRKAERRLKQRQRRVSRAVKASSRRKRRVRSLAVAHRKVSSRRSDFIHQISHQLTAKADVIALEDLNVRSMQQNRGLAKSVSDAGMAELIRQVKYKASWRGRRFVQIDRWHRSTGVCPDCGAVHERLDLSVRSWTCDGCGAAHDRDGAAARVIRLLALRMVGEGISEPASVMRRKRGESGPLRRGRGLRRKSARGTVNVSDARGPDVVACE